MRRLTGTGLRSREFKGSWFRGRGRLARGIGAAAIVTGVAGAALAVPTAAEASWTPIRTLTAPKWEGVDPAIAADAKGGFIAAWDGIDNADPNCGNQIQIRLRSSAGKWGRIHQLTPCGVPWNIFPAVAYNANGYGVVAWLRTAPTSQDKSGTDNAIQAVTVSPAGKIGRVLTITPKGNQAYFPMVAVSPTGHALVVWDTIAFASTGPLYGVLGRFISPGGALGPVRSLGASTQAVSAPVFDKSGTATVAYTVTKVYAVRFTSKHVGKPAVILSPAPGTGYSTPQLADDSNGDTFVLAALGVTTKSRYGEHLVVRKWSKARRLGKAITVGTYASTITVTNIADGPAFAADGAGDAVVVWNSALSSTRAAVYGRRLSHTGKLGRRVRLGTGYLSHIAIAPGGQGVVTWQSTPFQSGLITALYGRHVTATRGIFGRLIKFTSIGSYARIAVDSAGKSGVIWEGGSTLGSLIQARFGS
jgi:hypothetical protein